MIPENNNKDYVRNSIIFLFLAFALIFGWNYLFPPAQHHTTQTDEQKINQTTTATAAKSDLNTISNNEKSFTNSKAIKITTDNYIISLDEATGDIQSLALIKQKADDNSKANMVLLNKQINSLAQTRLISADNQFFLENTPYNSTQSEYVLGSNKDLVVTLTKENDNVLVKLNYIFKKDSYVIDIKYDITNKSMQPLNLTAMYRLLNNGEQLTSKTLFTKFYNGPVIYTPQDKYQKISFESISDNSATPPATAESGWLGIVQHYFASIFILQPKNSTTVCKTGACKFYFNQRPADKLYEVAFTTQIPTILANSNQSLDVELYSGPQETKALAATAAELPLTKDYGMFRIFANPLFVTLQYIENVTKNWGWAIILLVILLKIILYPLNAASAKSMAQMRHMGPKIEGLKKTYGDDKVKLQQAMMELYKKEKINPLGGCLPMLIQIPIFIGLYWAIFNSVELRGAPWIGWITDLSKIDPYFILPILMAATMVIQSFINPPPADPMQAKMMKIIPLVFSVMFFFFPSGLVLYWIVNNILTILQQWRFNRMYEKKHPN